MNDDDDDATNLKWVKVKGDDGRRGCLCCVQN
jgi:hypothetical protein